MIACIRRRECITLLGGAAAAWPLEARSQQRILPNVGYVNLLSFAHNAHIVNAFLRGLEEVGYT
ncbi:MAG TPA: hypothetical protein VGQ34_08700, partial [Sphingomicrobium sp.]|nr:hypothetical protein [Sphingomicrobium sp.]